jgi:hypothetical protein
MQTMSRTPNPMAKACIEAGKDLGIRVEHPYAFTTKHGRTAITQGVFLPDFGSPAGALLLCRFDSDEMYELAEDTNYFMSGLNPKSYEPYRRKLYTETLNDWGWFGGESKRPHWFTGAFWGHGQSRPV